MANLTVRMFPALLARVDELAEARKCSKAQVIRTVVLEATLPEDAPGIADEREALELLSVAARCGSVPAMRELLAFHDKQQQAKGAGDVFDELDDLAAR